MKRMLIFVIVFCFVGCGDDDSPTEPPFNTAPVADAGSDQVVTVGSQVQLDGTGSFDADADALIFLWMQTGGPEAELDDATAVQPTFTPTEPGQHRFLLLVNDGRDESAPDIVEIIVQSE